MFVFYTIIVRTAVGGKRVAGNAIKDRECHSPLLPETFCSRVRVSALVSPCRYGSYLRLLREDAVSDLTLLLKQVKAFLRTQRIQPASHLRILTVVPIQPSWFQLFITLSIH